MPLSLANQVVNRCLRITDQDNVTITVASHSIPLAEDLAVECFRNGADVLLNLYTDKYQSAYRNLLSVESLRQPSVFCKALTESSTAEIFLLAAYDPGIFTQTPAEKVAADSEGEQKAHYPLSREKKLRAISIGLPLLTKPRAKRYGFNFSRWSKMMTAATNVDYGKLAATGRKLKDVLSAADTVHVVAPGGTDLTLGVSGGHWSVSDGVIDDDDIAAEDFNDAIPAGSISICPGGAQGNIRFNAPTPYQGIAVNNVKWKFRDGRLTKFEGGASTRRLKDEWEHATGDKDMIASLSIGFNPAASTGFTFNDVAGGGVSVGIGSNEFNGGKNKSSFFFSGTLAGATVTADDKTVVRAGKIAIR
ncbi:MAG TPA: aminopeptidase [Nitrososphaerales archaeon]|nr:aminopeptidase [Nitrososphaerales archaeon]